MLLPHISLMKSYVTEVLVAASNTRATSDFFE